MKNYRIDNTEGFTEKELDCLNAEYDERIDDNMDDDYKQHISERILNECETIFRKRVSNLIEAIKKETGFETVTELSNDEYDNYNEYKNNDTQTYYVVDDEQIHVMQFDNAAGHFFTLI